MTLATDYLGLDALLSAGELAWRDTVRAFVRDRIRPSIRDWYENAVFPAGIATEMGGLGLLGTHLSGSGCAGRSAVEYGLAALELEAGDSGLRTFVSVQGSLAMSAIHKFGTEAHKERWLPGMAGGDLIGCLGLTEPEAGSDPASMTTTARRAGDGWVIDGAKRWIGLASIADVAVIWARTEDGIRGFLVPTTTPGVPPPPERAEAGHARLDPVRHHAHRRPGARGRDPARGRRPARPVRLPERGPLRDHLGCHGRSPRRLRGSPGLRAGPQAVRAADRVIPAHAGKAGRHGAGDPERPAGRAAYRADEGRRDPGS